MVASSSKSTRSEAGRKGGRATLSKKGRLHFVRIGKLGGKARGSNKKK